MSGDQPRLQRTQTLAASELGSRYYRVALKLDGLSLQQQGFAPASLAPYSLEDAVSIKLGDDPIRYPDRGVCLYCPAKELRPGTGLELSEEHIIAEGIGGSLILPKASCEKCAGITSAIESDVQLQLLLAPKVAMGIRGKNRSPQTTMRLQTLKNGRNSRAVMLGNDRHPAILFLLALTTPNILARRVGPAASGMAGVWFHAFGSFDGIKEMGIEELASPSFDTIRFCQFLAKIAHGFAAATATPGSYEPLLIDFIKKRVPRRGADISCYDFVGGVPKSFAPSSATHELTLERLEARGTFYLSVHIRLFGHLGSPVYSVVVGKMRAPPPTLSPALI